MHNDTALRPAMLASLHALRAQAQARIDAAPDVALDALPGGHLLLDTAIVATCDSVVEMLDTSPLPADMVYRSYCKMDREILASDDPLATVRLYAWTLVGALALTPVASPVPTGARQ